MTEPIPAAGLARGDVGAVVHVYGGSAAYEVEFIDESGRTKCVVTVPADHIMRPNLLKLSA